MHCFGEKVASYLLQENFLCKLARKLHEFSPLPFLSTLLFSLSRKSKLMHVNKKMNISFDGRTDMIIFNLFLQCVASHSETRTYFLNGNFNNDVGFFSLLAFIFQPKSLCTVKQYQCLIFFPT